MSNALSIKRFSAKEKQKKGAKVEIVRCEACDGYGWTDDEETGEGECRWCGAIGYVYRDAQGIDRRIPAADYERQAARLEALEVERLRELGYSGASKKPWEQDVRKGTKLGNRPDAESE